MRKVISKKPARSASPIPANFPHHNFDEPYSDLLTSGEFDDEDDVLAIALKIALDHGEKGALQLAAIACDDTFDDYIDFYENPEDFYQLDKRWAARSNAILVLSMMPEHAAIVLEQMLDQLDSDDDLVVETLPFYFANVGELAIRPLIEIVNDPEEEGDGRASAVDCLTEIAEAHPELKKEIVRVFETALIRAEDEPALNSQLVMGLLDCGSKESSELIFDAFRKHLIDPGLISIEETELHLGFKAVPPIDGQEISKAFGYDTLDEYGDDILNEDESDVISDPDSEPQTPYVAELKVGRNDPCPCGSGKKYKKCCGRAV